MKDFEGRLYILYLGILTSYMLISPEIAPIMLSSSRAHKSKWQIDTSGTDCGDVSPNQNPLDVHGPLIDFFFCLKVFLSLNLPTHSTF